MLSIGFEEFLQASQKPHKIIIETLNFGFYAMLARTHHILNPNILEIVWFHWQGSKVYLKRFLSKEKPGDFLCFCYYPQGILYQAGDVVSIEDIEGDLYYAQLRGFLQDQYAQKTAVITWLIPMVPKPSHFDPALFLPGNYI